MMIVKFILQILTAFHEATPPSNVVSAFEQAGICSRSSGTDPYMARRETYVDRSRAREVVKELGLFRDLPRIEEEHQQLKIADMNSAMQRAMQGEEAAPTSSAPSSAVAAHSAPVFPHPAAIAPPVELRDARSATGALFFPRTTSSVVTGTVVPPRPSN